MPGRSEIQINKEVGWTDEWTDEWKDEWINRCKGKVVPMLNELSTTPLRRMGN
jgi:hypothetical protein